MIHFIDRRSRKTYDYGWLHTHYTFSFGEYFDPDRMGYQNLRVINHDVIQPNQGFGKHGHRDMEIISFVLQGALRHTDSLGNQRDCRPGEIQAMSAGSGIQHSEWNPSTEESTELFQVWFQPSQKGISPIYKQIDFREDLKNCDWAHIVGSTPMNPSVHLNQKKDPIYLNSPLEIYYHFQETPIHKTTSPNHLGLPEPSPNATSAIWIQCMLGSFGIHSSESSTNGPQQILPGDALIVEPGAKFPELTPLEPRRAIAAFFLG